MDVYRARRVARFLGRGVVLVGLVARAPILRAPVVSPSAERRFAVLADTEAIRNPFGRGRDAALDRVVALSLARIVLEPIDARGKPAGAPLDLVWDFERGKYLKRIRSRSLDGPATDPERPVGSRPIANRSRR